MDVTDSMQPTTSRCRSRDEQSIVRQLGWQLCQSVTTSSMVSRLSDPAGQGTDGWAPGASS